MISTMGHTRQLLTRVLLRLVSNRELQLHHLEPHIVDEEHTQLFHLGYVGSLENKEENLF